MRVEQLGQPVIVNVNVRPGRPGRTWRRWIAFGAWLVVGAATLVWGSVGCVRVYQPMSGFHRPTVVNPQLPNFEDLRVELRCVPGGLLDASEASALCRKIAVLFENQGATIRDPEEEARVAEDDPADPNTMPGLEVDAADEGASADAAVADEPEAPRTDLIMEVRARQTHFSGHPISWVLCVSSFTFLAGTLEQGFAQDVVIRDANGFLLVSDTFEGRIVSRMGLGPWLGNGIVDITMRKRKDRLIGDAMDRDISDDLYRQLSQDLFNAKMQRQVLSQAPSGRVAGQAQ